MNAEIWVMFSALLVGAVIWAKGKKPLLAALDSRTARIKADLEEAERLKKEAEQLLADYKKKHADAVETAKKIIENAEETVTLMQKKAEQTLADSLKRHEAMLLERISRAEESAVQDLRHQAADIAAAAAEHMLTGAMRAHGPKLVDAAIKDLPQKMN
ncbi:MAG: F0F1 ATP synthase subunit B [Alphaproteobacteria bacterium]|nr:F0F1 ATP synthase subunit B [Alphaproteobacteria bacterium]MDE2335696.1 F0F1 ATP synthase subunit B [Alphaproteobacteria bacterium]